MDRGFYHFSTRISPGDIFGVVVFKRADAVARLTRDKGRFCSDREQKTDIGVAGVIKRPWPDIESAKHRLPLPMIKIIFADRGSLNGSKDIRLRRYMEGCVGPEHLHEVGV